MRNMQNLERTRQWERESNDTVGNNYIREAWNAMTKATRRGIDKAESNPVRTQLWANVVLTLSVSVALPFFAWLGFHLIDFGEQRANQKFIQQKNDEYKQEIEKQQKEIEALKQQQEVAPEPTNTKPSKKRSQSARSRKLSGQIEQLYSSPLLPARAEFTPTLERIIN